MADTKPVNYPLVTFDYSPNKPAAIIAGAVYAVVGILLSIRLILRKTWWGLCLPTGTFCFSVGFFLRYESTISTSELPPFVFSQLLIVVSPAAFLAFNYIVYGRLVRTFAVGRSQYSLMRPEIVARVFIISDVVTFLVQGGGGGLQTNEGSADVGRIILLTGIIVQTISYVIFYLLLIHSHRIFRKDDKFDEHNFPWRLMHVLHFSSIFIMIRAAYRTVELAEGNGGYLLTHEIFFYLLDTIPLFLATAIYILFWPGRMMEDVYSREYPLIGLAHESS